MHRVRATGEAGRQGARPGSLSGALSTQRRRDRLFFLVGLFSHCSWGQMVADRPPPAYAVLLASEEGLCAVAQFATRICK